MAVIFPDPSTADPMGIVCVGGSMDVETLYQAYSQAIFPWPHEGFPLLWFSPHERGVIEFQDLHLPRSLRKEVRRKNWSYSVNRDFSAVVRGCRFAKRKGETGTWISSEIAEAYLAFHRAGHAHSFEIWNEDQLVGGIYGVFVKGVLSGESMFFAESGAGKVALLVAGVLAQRFGLQWMDIQMTTPVTEALGGKLLKQAEFLEKMRSSQQDNTVETDFSRFLAGQSGRASELLAVL